MKGAKELKIASHNCNGRGRFGSYRNQLLGDGWWPGEASNVATQLAEQAALKGALGLAQFDSLKFQVRGGYFLPALLIMPEVSKLRLYEKRLWYWLTLQRISRSLKSSGNHPF